jgi:hypothetical protein
MQELEYIKSILTLNFEKLRQSTEEPTKVIEIKESCILSAEDMPAALIIIKNGEVLWCGMDHRVLSRNEIKRVNKYCGEILGDKRNGV